LQTVIEFEIMFMLIMRREVNTFSSKSVTVIESILLEMQRHKTFDAS